MKFTLEIELGNDAMMDRHDVAEALRKVAGRLDGAAVNQAQGFVPDENGNVCGAWRLEQDLERY